MSKELIHLHLQLLLNEKIQAWERAIASVKESRDQGTKSSVGDKYETGRAMMQVELEKLQVQLSNTEKLKAQLQGLRLNEKSQRVKPGSLVITDYGSYFISVGIGQIKINGEKIYAVSPVAPVGKLLLGKSIGDVVRYNDRKILIEEIL